MSTRQFPKLREAPKGNPFTQGTVAITTADLARFSVFSECLIGLLAYSSSVGENGLIADLVWQKGSNITGNLNEAAAKVQGDWMWTMGDDHFFAVDLLEQLLSHNVDVVAPHCLVRSAPFLPVVYSGEEEDPVVEGTHIVHMDLPPGGLVEVYAVGGAGLLVKKHVLDAIGQKYGHECRGCKGKGQMGEEPCLYCDGKGFVPVYFETYGKQNEDLEFCRKIRECGFKIHCDTSALLGHIGNMVVAPGWHEDFGWGVKMYLGGAEHKPVFFKRVDARTVTPA